MNFNLAEIQSHIMWLIAGGFFSAFGFLVYRIFPWIGHMIQKEVRTGLREEIETTIRPDLEKVHKRIDDHMNVEENSFEALSEDVAHMREKLEEREPMFKEIMETLESNDKSLREHMLSDAEQFASAAEALVDGQKYLDEKLTTIVEATKKKLKKIR